MSRRSEWRGKRTRSCAICGNTTQLGCGASLGDAICWTPLCRECECPNLEEHISYSARRDVSEEETG